MGSTGDMMNDNDYLQPAYRQNLSSPVSRTSILNLQAAIATIPGHMTEDDFNPVHHFSEGVYVRELFIKAGDVVVGKIHRHNHMAMLVHGRAIVVDESGRVEMEAFNIWESKAGVKRAVYAIEDCIFVTIHPTDETDLDKIEQDVIAPSYAALERES